MPEARTLTQQELLDEATERFGPDPYNWAFQCPSCGDIATGSDFRETLARLRRTDVTASQLLGQECIGRIMGALGGGPAGDGGRAHAERGCDWAAYGLLPAPWTVLTPEGGKIHCFPLAPREEKAS